MKKIVLVWGFLVLYALCIVAYLPSTYNTPTARFASYLKDAFNETIRPDSTHWYVVLGERCPGCVRATCRFLESLNSHTSYTVITRYGGLLPSTGARVLIDTTGLCDRCMLFGYTPVAVVATRYGKVDSVMQFDVENLESLSSIPF